MIKISFLSGYHQVKWSYLLAHRKIFFKFTSFIYSKFWKCSDFNRIEFSIQESCRNLQSIKSQN